MSSVAKVFMLSFLANQAYHEPNKKLRLIALKIYRDEIDKIPENMFHHKGLDADIKKLEQEIESER